ncbi:hypothetical protein ABPG77_000812 [Micractinium sp. CCAP 211/92]
MLRSAPLSRVLRTAWPSTRPGPRQQPGGLRLNAPERRRIRRLAARASTPSDSDYQYDSYDSDDELPPPPTPFDPSLCDIVELKQETDRFIAELEAYDRAVERRHARELAKARKASAAVGLEAAAEAAFEAAGTKPASAVSSAGDEWLRAAEAWRKAFDSVQAARRAQPGAAVVDEAAAHVEAARRFKRQLRGLPGRVAEDLP